MGAFDRSTKVRRFVADPLTDHKLPRPASLSWKAITTPAAVSGTAGTHCELVHGNCWYQINGHHTEMISGNQSHTVMRDQTVKIGGRHKETIVKDCYQNIIGPHTVTNHNVRNETRLDTYTEVYGDNEKSQDSTGDMQVLGEDLSLVYFLVMEVDLLKFELEASHFELKGVHITGEGINNQAQEVNSEESGVGDSTSDIYQRLCALKSNLHGALTVLALTNLNDSQFTQCLTLLGENQAI